MSVVDNLNRIKACKEDIKQAINNKGVTVADSDSFTLYANKISEIQAGGGNEEEIAKTARVLDITENGIYTSQYTQDKDYLTIPDLVTGVFPDGTNFYNWADINDGHFNTNVCPTANSRIEFWWKPAETSKGVHYQNIFGAGLSDNNGPDCFEIHYYSTSRTQMRIKIGSNQSTFIIDNTIWNHFVIDSGYLYVNDELKAQVDTSTYVSDGSSILINSTPSRYMYNGNGLFGMFKIDGHIFIPSKDGFINYETGQLLTGYLPTDATRPFDGIYNFVDNYTQLPAEGNLIRTLKVNVPTKLSDRKINFGYSTFTKIPDGLIDWQKITHMDSMFRECNLLKDLGDIDTSNIVSFKYAFYGCTQLADFSKINLSNATSLNYAFANTKIDNDVINNFDTSNVIDLSNAFYNTPITYFPSIDTSKVTTFRSIFENSMNLEEVHPIDTSKATDLSYMFYNFSSEHKLRKLPEFDCTNVTSMNNMFSYYQDRMDYFTDCGGWKNLKCNWSDNYGLRACANLTYQSCINILNGLWDFRGNGDSTTTRTLKVHQNFLDLVGDEVSIGTVKGWNITV